MPEILVVGGVVRCTIRHTYTNGRAVDNVLDMKVTHTPPETRQDAIDSMVRDVLNNWQDEILGLNLLNNNLVLTDLHWLDLDDDDGNSGTIAPDPGKPLNGGNAGAGATINCAYLVHKNGAVGRRRRQGRMYLGGVGEANITEDGILSAGTVTDLNAGLSDFLDGINDDAILHEEQHLVVVHFRRDPDTHEIIDSSIGQTRVDSLTVDTLVATQRRRLRA